MPRSATDAPPTPPWAARAPAAAGGTAPSTGAGSSALPGRVTVGISDPIHRAPQAGILASVGAFLRRIVAAFPATARRGGTSAEGEPLLRKEQARTGSPPLDPEWLGARSDHDLGALAAQLGQETAAARTRMQAGGTGTYSEEDLLTIDAEARVRAEIITRTQARIDSDVDGILSAAVELAKGNGPPGQIALRIHNALVNADGQLAKLEKQGVTHIGADGHRAAASRWVAARLGRLPAEELRRLLQAAAAADLARLAKEDPADITLTRHSAAAITAARAEVAERDVALLARFETDTGTLLEGCSAGGNAGAPEVRQLAQDLFAAGASLSALQAHDREQGKALPEEARRQCRLVGERLQAWLSTSEPDLGALPAVELDRFIAILKQFDAPPPSALLLRAADSRLPGLEAGFEAAAGTMLRGLIEDEPEAVLRGLREMDSRFGELRDTRHAILRDIKSSQDSFGLRERLVSDVLWRLSDADAAAVFASLHRPATRALLEGLYAASDAATAARREALGTTLTTLGAYLEETAAQAADHLDQRAGALRANAKSIPRDERNQPLMPDSDERITPEQLTPAARTAFRELFGIDWPPGGEPAFPA